MFFCVNPNRNGTFGAKNMECPFYAFSPADPKIVSEDTNKMSKSQQLIYTT